jgi:uncharacterized membrane protein YoaK (UPF0700 family)
MAMETTPTGADPGQQRAGGAGGEELNSKQERRTSESLALGIILALAAGSIEAYSIIWLGAFAGAQTGNVVFGSIALSHLHWATAARYGVPILAFIGGVLLSNAARSGRFGEALHRPFRVLLTVETATLVVVGFLPASMPKLVSSVLITIAVAAQAATFRTLVDVGYNSAFTTGNLMNAVGMAYTAVTKRDHEAYVHTRRGAIVIVSYAVGAVGGALSTRAFNRHGVWCGAIILVAGLLLFVTDERMHHQSVAE